MGWFDKLKNKKDEAKGAAKEHLGQATDDEQMEREGQTDQSVSNIKQAGPAILGAAQITSGGRHRRPAAVTGTPLRRELR